MNIIKIIKYILIYLQIYTDRNNVKRLRCFNINYKGLIKLNIGGNLEITNEWIYYMIIIIIEKKKLFGIKLNIN